MPYTLLYLGFTLFASRFTPYLLQDSKSAGSLSQRKPGGSGPGGSGPANQRLLPSLAHPPLPTPLTPPPMVRGRRIRQANASPSPSPFPTKLFLSVPSHSHIFVSLQVISSLPTLSLFRPAKEHSIFHPLSLSSSLSLSLSPLSPLSFSLLSLFLSHLYLSIYLSISTRSARSLTYKPSSSRLSCRA